MTSGRIRVEVQGHRGETLSAEEYRSTGVRMYHDEERFSNKRENGTAAVTGTESIIDNGGVTVEFQGQ